MSTYILRIQHLGDRVLEAVDDQSASLEAPDVIRRRVGKFLHLELRTRRDEIRTIVGYVILRDGAAMYRGIVGVNGECYESENADGLLSSLREIRAQAKGGVQHRTGLPGTYTAANEYYSVRVAASDSLDAMAAIYGRPHFHEDLDSGGGEVAIPFGIYHDLTGRLVGLGVNGLVRESDEYGMDYNTHSFMESADGLLDWFDTACPDDSSRWSRVLAYVESLAESTHSDNAAGVMEVAREYGVLAGGSPPRLADLSRPEVYRLVAWLLWENSSEGLLRPARVISDLEAHIRGLRRDAERLQREAQEAEVLLDVMRDDQAA